MNAKIGVDSLMTLEAYAKARAEFRARVIAHKKSRTLAIGEHVTLVFEDELTVRYQIQEMLRIERIFEEAGIRAELDAYNPLVPDGDNWKATMLIEYPAIEERRIALAALRGIEHKVWMRIAGHAPVYAIADEDLERTNEDKTSAVHFLRFQLSAAQAGAVRADCALSAGIDHPAYNVTVEPLDAALRASLRSDMGNAP